MSKEKQHEKPWVSETSGFKLSKLGIVSHAENNRFKNKVKSLIQKCETQYLNNFFQTKCKNLNKKQPGIGLRQLRLRILDIKV